MSEERASFGSKIGIIMATEGSPVIYGNRHILQVKMAAPRLYLYI